LIDDMIAEGDQVAVRAVTKGTHKGDLLGLPPTGKEVIQPFHVVYRIANGKIIEHWMVINRLEVMQQLGVIPEDLGDLGKEW
ncbi:MAG: ester cyclase, partial [Deltaproteobacteria bacterium]|nr:ester cyclase [Deltaproteobacteria bacterium]